jgi:hypothetical protein
MAELGIADVDLVDYVANLLVRFVPSDQVWRLRDTKGRRLQNVLAMVAEAEAAGDERRRGDCHRHVGDFTLFWTGVYPEAFERVRNAVTGEELLDLQKQGKRSYYLASTLGGESCSVLRRLSDEFERCAFGLSRIRLEWERHDASPTPRRPFVL